MMAELVAGVVRLPTHHIRALKKEKFFQHFSAPKNKINNVQTTCMNKPTKDLVLKSGSGPFIKLQIKDLFDHEMKLKFCLKNIQIFV